MLSLREIDDVVTGFSNVSIRSAAGNEADAVGSVDHAVIGGIEYNVIGFTPWITETTGVGRIARGLPIGQFSERNALGIHEVASICSRVAGDERVNQV